MSNFRLTVDSVDDLPYLLLTPDTASEETPLVLALHGLGSRKEKILPTALAFAQQGLRVAAPDARLHGERPFAAEREQRLTTAYVPTMYELIAGTAQDVTRLLDHLGAARAAVHGISLGGYIAFAALVSEPRLAVSSVAMGSPDWLEPLRALGVDLSGSMLAMLAQANPLDNAARSYPPRPLLMLHGMMDDVVSPAGVQALEQRLRPAYAGEPERLKLVLYPDLGHQYTDEMLQQSIAWTQRFL